MRFGRKTRSDLVTRHGYIAVKRVLDTALVIAAAPVVVPIALGTAAAVRLKLGRPVLFKQNRIGLDEEEFELLKFRSMLPETDSDGNTLSPSERLTNFGKALRKSSLDEVPQLWNVLRGDMSLIGPRPLLPRYLGSYRASERARHSVRPGITGMAQVSGRNDLSWDHRLSLDANHALNASIFDEFLILLKTVVNVLKREGARPDVSSTGVFLDEERQMKRAAIELRPLEFGDLPARVALFNDDRVFPTMYFSAPLELEATQRWFETLSSRPERRDWVAVDGDSGDVAGFIGCRPLDDPAVPEIYIAVDPDNGGRGIGTDMVKLALGQIRELPGTTGAAAEMYVSNRAVSRIFEKNGFQDVDSPDSRDRKRMSIHW